MSETASAFDRSMSVIDCPDVLSTKPTTVTSINGLLGHMGTHIIQTARHKEDGFTLFVQVLDIGGGSATQLVLPDKVCQVIYRQRQALIDRSRRKPTPKLTPEQRQKKKLADARKVLREAKKARQ